ncbi:MAG: hypothetical protein KHX29_08710, partial [Prevotella buccalis]|nr:hypothetical protein [Hoylesella buccalis]
MKVYLGGIRLMLLRIQIGIFSMQNIKNKLLHQIPCRFIWIIDTFDFMFFFSIFLYVLVGFVC